MSIYDNWEAVIGLEIHAELNTKSKLFSSAPNRFGDEPNTNINQVCTGQPGALPVLNKEAIKKAVQFGCAINGTIAKFSRFDRKSYFYPDSPRNFQITQYDQPIVLGGIVVAEVNGKEQSFKINRVHLEDDSGMLKHFSNFAGVDYNRAGVPLIEIVSEACIHTAEEAIAYAQSVKAILQYLDVSDCNMEEGSLRFDVNVSVRLKGETSFRTKTEIKNMNSFTNMGIAIQTEVQRQIHEYINHANQPIHEVIPHATYRFDPETGSSILMRKKEQADDYRYFPEPDLVPIILTDAYIKEIKDALPELPLQRKRRYVNELQLSEHHAFVLVSDKKLADFFEEALKTKASPKNLCNWIVVEFSGRFKDTGTTLLTSNIKASHVGKLVKMIDKDTITGKIAKVVADEMVKEPLKDPEEIVKENPDFSPVHDLSEISILVDQVIKENPQSLLDLSSRNDQKGKEKVFGFLVGQVMKLSKGKASPKAVNELLNQKLQL